MASLLFRPERLSRQFWGCHDCLPNDKLPTDKLPTDKLPTDKLPTDKLPTDKMPTIGNDIICKFCKLDLRPHLSRATL